MDNKAAAAVTGVYSRDAEKLALIEKYFPGIKPTGCNAGTYFDRIVAAEKRGSKKSADVDLGDVEMTAGTFPVVSWTNDMKRMNLSGNYDEKQRVNKKFGEEMNPLVENLAKHELDAFETMLLPDNTEILLCYNSKNIIWLYKNPNVGETTTTNGETKYHHDFQYGMFSPVANVATMGFVYVAGTKLNTSALVSIAVTGIVGYFIGKVFAGGAKLAIKAILSRVAVSLFTRWGIIVLIGSAASVVVGLATLAVFILCQMGLDVFWEWINRQYTVTQCIYNCDPQHDWRLVKVWGDNAKVIGDADTPKMDIDQRLKKMEQSGEQMFPPGFVGGIRKDPLVHYGTMIYENDGKFLRGCGEAYQLVRMMKNNPDDNVVVDDDDTPLRRTTEEPNPESDWQRGISGFAYAYDLPRFKDARHKVKDGLDVDLEEFHGSSGDWSVDSTLFVTKIRGKEESVDIPILCTLDYKSGAPENKYNSNVYINTNSLPK